MYSLDNQLNIYIGKVRIIDLFQDFDVKRRSSENKRQDCLDIGITHGRKLKSFFEFGWFPFIFSIVIPIVNGCLFAFLSSIVTDDVSSRFIFAALGASTSYIAVPAAMKISVPKSNSGLYLPMALAVTFPIHITIGLPLCFLIVQFT